MSVLATRRPRERLQSRRIKEPKSDRAFLIINYGVLAMFCISVLYPLIFVLSASVSSASAINSGQVVLWPVGFNVDAYVDIFNSPELFGGLRNSLFYAIAAAMIGTVITILAAYPLSRQDLPFRRPLIFFFLVPTMFSAGIIPNYIVVRSLGLLDTVWAVILPGAMAIFNLIVTRAFYQLNIPHELLEAARVDGANDFRFFFQVALPLSKPIIAVNMLFYAVTQWNGWFSAFLYLTNDDLYPLQLVLRNILAKSKPDPTQLTGVDIEQLMRNQELFDKLKYAVIVVAMLPPLIAYPFVQKHFVKGALIGSLK